MSLKSKQVIYCFFWFIFLINQLAQRYLNIVVPYIHSYLDDVLLFPILMPFIQWIHYVFTKKQILPYWFIALLFIYISATVEFLFPIWSNHFTFDWFDFGAYFIGLLIFELVFNKNFKY